MAATTNAYAFLDSITGQVYAYVVDTAKPPGLLSPNNTYWRNFITTETGNPIMAVSIPVATYNSNTHSQLASFIATAIALLNTIALT